MYQSNTKEVVLTPLFSYTSTINSIKKIQEKLPMLRKSTLLLCTVILMISAGEFSQKHQIPTRETIEGETLGAAVLKKIDTLLYVYSNSNRSLTIFTTEGAYHGTIYAESIGRNGYLGDDFTLSKDTLYFLNSVDNRIEKFLLPSGKHIGSQPIDADIFNERNPVLTIATQITLRENELYIGNMEKLVSLSTKEEIYYQRIPQNTRTAIQIDSIRYRITTDSLIGEVIR